MADTPPEPLAGRTFTHRTLRGSRFVDCDLGEVVVRGSEVAGMEIDSPWLMEDGSRLLVNGVDVVPLVDAELNRRFPGRELRTATDPEGLRAAWAALAAAWAATLQRATGMPPGTVDASVAGEWSFAQTLRHLVMATDTWLGKAVLEREHPYHPAGLPNDDGGGSAAYDGSEFADAEPTFEVVLQARAERQAMVATFLAQVSADTLAAPRHNPHAPEHEKTVLSCLRTILDEEWEHLRYAVRDLDALTAIPTSSAPYAPAAHATDATDATEGWQTVASNRPEATESHLSANGLGDEVIDWLLDGDPAIRWQVMCDLLDTPEPTWRAARATVETTGYGAALLSHQDPDGLWAGGVFVPDGFTRELWQHEGQPWTASAYAMNDLREWGLEPTSEAAVRTVRFVGANGRWDEGDQPFWQGEVEECINGRTLADGAYFGVDMAPLAARLVAEQQPDGGWNCERANGSVRSSFDSTINVLEGLLEFERATRGTTESQAARRGGEEFLLERGLFRRRTTGEPADAAYILLGHPRRWHYDVLRALDYFRASAILAGTAQAPVDPRLADALVHLRGRRLPDGRWPLDVRHRGRQWFEVDEGVGMPSRWVTLSALRVLRWADMQ